MVSYLEESESPAEEDTADLGLAGVSYPILPAVGSDGQTDCPVTLEEKG
jgi:hypothetical protein